MSIKHKITSVKKKMVDGVHTVDLSHNQDKSEWFVTLTGEFYTELTFRWYDDAEKMYGIIVNCKNIFMDSLAVGILKREPYLPKIDIVKATSAEAIEYHEKSNKYKMSDAEVIAYEEGN